MAENTTITTQTSTKDKRPVYENISGPSGSGKSSPKSKSKGGSGSPHRRRGSATEWYVDLPQNENTERSTKPTVRKYENINIEGEVSSDIAVPPLTSEPAPRRLNSDIVHGSPIQLRNQRSQPALGVERNPLLENGFESRQTALDARLRLLTADSLEKDGGCEKCKELESVVALWELGVSGLTRNYSKILSQLNKAREASRKLEGQLKERNEPINSLHVSSGRNMSVSGRSAKSYNARQSMYETTAAASPAVSIVNQMYPQDQVLESSSSSLPLPHMKQFKELNSHLGQAIDLCQQLAAASFKSNQRTLSKKQKLVRQPTVPSNMTEDNSDFRPTLQSIAEASLSGSFKRQKPPLERTPSVPDSLIRSQETLDEEPEKGKTSLSEFVTVESNGHATDEIEQPITEASVATVSPDSASPTHSDNECIQSPTSLSCPKITFGEQPTTTVSSSNQKQFYSHMMKLNEQNDEPDSEKSSELSGESDDKPNRDKRALSSTTDSQLGYRDSMLSMASSFSDHDVKQVMSKIADLEEERLKLLGTIDDLQRDNGQVRLSFTEILGDLENKDLQLTLAMQDLTIATGEIKRAADMRKLLQQMETDRNALLERLSNLEDESAAVKVSLIQLLQEKSATNKTLALENWRLSQRMKAVSTLRRGSLKSNGAGPGAGDGDNVSVTSGFSGATEDATLQEAYMGADDVAAFVHKQGFLVKQGGKVKSWKRRLFVLSTEGLAYFKTEQPLQTVPIEKVEKVQICHNKSQYPNLFEVHTPGRVFLLSAPSEDEMQSWVGMLQTLKQYNRATTLNREATLRAQANLRAAQAANVPPASINGQHGEDTDEEEGHLTLHQEHFGSGQEDDDDAMYLVSPGDPMSVPTLPSPLDDAENQVDPGNFLKRLHSDSM